MSRPPERPKTVSVELHLPWHWAVALAYELNRPEQNALLRDPLPYVSAVVLAEIEEWDT